jgi:hypothetical protein
LYDAGGRGWSDPSVVVTYTGTCNTRTQTTTTTRTKTGCPPDVRPVTVSSPNCDPYDTGCYNAPTGEYVYRYSCASRERAIKYTFTTKGTCPEYSYTTAYEASPTCDGSCTTANTADFVGPNGYTYYYNGTPGNFVVFIGYPDGTGGCSGCPPGQVTYDTLFYVSTCNGTRTIAPISCGTCTDFG